MYTYLKADPFSLLLTKYDEKFSLNFEEEEVWMKWCKSIKDTKFQKFVQSIVFILFNNKFVQAHNANATF